jgi:hypothetical protein
MTKAGQCAAVGAVLMAVWAAVITGTVATNETVVGLMPFAPFYLLCCFGVSARTRASHAHTDTLARAHRHQPAVVSIGQPRISLTTCATSWPVPSGVDVPLATIGPSLQAVGISELASWQAVLMYPCLPALWKLWIPTVTRSDYGTLASCGCESLHWSTLASCEFPWPCASLGVPSESVGAL